LVALQHPELVHSLAIHEPGSLTYVTDAVIAIQAVAEVCPKSADVVQAGNFGPIRTFVEYATAEQKARFLPRILAGESVIALGMSEYLDQIVDGRPIGPDLDANV